MKIYKSLAWPALAAVVVLGGATGTQAADDPSWYAGAGIGRADIKRASSLAAQTDAALSTQGVTSNTLIGDSHDTAWKLFAGYRFNEFVAAEGGFYRLGDFNGTTTVTAPVPGSAGGSWDAKAIGISAVLTYPVGKGFGLLFRGGLAVSRLEVSVPAGTGFNSNETRVQPLLGLGVNFDVTKTVSLRGEFERFNNVGDGSTTGQSPINVWSMNALYRF